MCGFFAAFIVFTTFLQACQEGNLRFSTFWKNSVEVQDKNNKNHKYPSSWEILKWYSSILIIFNSPTPFSVFLYNRLAL